MQVGLCSHIVFIAVTQKTVSSILKDLKKVLYANSETTLLVKYYYQDQSKANKDIPMKPKSSPGHKKPPEPAVTSPRPPSEPMTSPVCTDDGNTDQTTGTAPVSVTVTDDGKKSPEPGAPEWVYADLSIPEVNLEMK